MTSDQLSGEQTSDWDPLAERCDGPCPPIKQAQKGAGKKEGRNKETRATRPVHMLTAQQLDDTFRPYTFGIIKYSHTPGDMQKSYTKCARGT